MDIFVANWVSRVVGPLEKDASTIEDWLVRVECTFVVAANVTVDFMFVVAFVFTADCPRDVVGTMIIVPLSLVD